MCAEIPSDQTAGGGGAAALSAIRIGGRDYRFARLLDADAAFGRLPVSLKILAENILRHDPAELVAFRDWLHNHGRTFQTVSFHPRRVLMHDTTCVPALADFAALRDAVAAAGADPRAVNPVIPVDLVVDHSVMVDDHGSAGSFSRNLKRDFERNGERYAFIRWAQKNLDNFRVVPPATGILHQINLEHLSSVVYAVPGGAAPLLIPDALVGTDSHTPMVNALGMLAWGVGGLEGQAAALGQALSIRLPEVLGIRVTGNLRSGVTAMDLALTVTQTLRRHGVVEKIVEFFGPGLASLTVADRATVSNMAPEYGATCAFFPVDAQTLNYLSLVGHSAEHVAIVEAYAHTQGLWHEPDREVLFTEQIALDLSAVEASLSGPKRPHDRVGLGDVAASFRAVFPGEAKPQGSEPGPITADRAFTDLKDGAVLIAAITSCTSTSNPALMIGAGLVARNALAAGLSIPSWVKTSLSPGSRAVSGYLTQSGLQADLDALGFNLTGYGCMTCIGNSGALDSAVLDFVASRQITGAAVLSGNRNFEGRINPAITAAYLASPALVVVYALAGSVLLDLNRDPVGHASSGQPVYLRDIWPSSEDIGAAMAPAVTRKIFTDLTDDVFTGPREWQEIGGTDGFLFPWDPTSTYIRRPPYFDGITRAAPGLADLHGARLLVMLSDNITTDHISPAGEIPRQSLAGDYLSERQVPVSAFNQYSTRRGNHEVMMLGVFTNPNLRNELLAKEGLHGGLTRLQPEGEILSVYDAAMRYKATGTPLIVIAGREYGSGSSRDWGAKGPALLGIRAVIAESFERIHRSNLIGTGILPLQFMPGQTRHDLALDGTELLDLTGLDGEVAPRQTVMLNIRHPDRPTVVCNLILCVETAAEIEHLRHGGLLPHVLRDLLHESEMAAAGAHQ